MRTRSLAAITLVFAIAACSDVASPDAMNPGATSQQETLSQSDHQQACDANDHHWGKHARRFRRWGRSPAASSALSSQRRHRWGRRQDDNDQECGGGAAPATVSGTVTNNGTGAVSYAVHLLSADGLTVVATANTDATGAYSFAAVVAGTYLVCESNPYTEAHGWLGETRPNTGAACPAAYGPLGFSLTVAAGATLTGNSFNNMSLD